tara:strand:- start:3793 stop:4434 length:642 start_codon:yes stop_codon:yes gene_type:complete
MKKFNYNIKKYDFANEIKKLYNISNLDNIHSEWDKAISYDVLDDVKTDQRTVYHKHFYDNVNTTNWYSLYEKFISEVVVKIVGEPIYFQKIPTFRVHQPKNLAVAAYHKDSDYSHSIHEMNFFLPLTKAFGNNTVWVESEIGKGDYLPMEADYGELWYWNGATLKHGNKLNDTGKARVSVDFRIIPVAKYVDEGKQSITNKTKMVLGEYWKAC